MSASARDITSSSSIPPHAVDPEDGVTVAEGVSGAADTNAAGMDGEQGGAARDEPEEDDESEDSDEDGSGE